MRVALVLQGSGGSSARTLRPGLQLRSWRCPHCCRCCWDTGSLSTGEGTRATWEHSPGLQSFPAGGLQAIPLLREVALRQ